jgi:hypothetical protein
MGGDELDGSKGSIDEKLAPGDFVTDFVWAARAVFAQPSVLVVSIGLWVLPMLLPSGNAFEGHFLLAAAAVCLFSFFGFGWLGAERLFFLHRREGRPVTLGDLFLSVPEYAGRFLKLGFLVGIAVAPLWIIVAHWAGRFDAAAPAASRAAGRTIALLTIMVPVDLALTFVTSALVYTTDSAREALRIGLAMIRQTWPRSGLYVLCPPLALNFLNTIYPTNIRVVHFVTTAGLALLALLAKGATAAFYLRERAASAETPANPDASATV